MSRFLGETDPNECQYSIFEYSLQNLNSTCLEFSENRQKFLYSLHPKLHIFHTVSAHQQTVKHFQVDVNRSNREEFNTVVLSSLSSD